MPNIPLRKRFFPDSFIPTVPDPIQYPINSAFPGIHSNLRGLIQQPCGKYIMARVIFSTLPPEIHAIIAEHCENNDLINLCLTAKCVHWTFLPLLYRHVDLQPDQDGLDCSLSKKCDRMIDALKRQQRLVHTLLSHRSYGKHVRTFKGTLCVASYTAFGGSGDSLISDLELWHAMQSLTRVQNVEIGSKNGFVDSMAMSKVHLPTGFFQSATSVSLVGRVPHGLANSILNAINPSTLKHLHLNIDQDSEFRQSIGHEAVPSGGFGTNLGLLTTLTGRCAALRTLIMRNNHSWDPAANTATYTEWSSFIRSVQGTVEKFTFEQRDEIPFQMRSHYTLDPRPLCMIDDIFERFLLPAIASENWSRLEMIMLRGVRGSNSEGGIAGLAKILKDALGGDTRVVIEE